VEESPWQLELDLVDTIKDLEALIKENTVHWWNQELNGYAKEMCMHLWKCWDRRFLQPYDTLEDLQVEQRDHDNTDTIKMFCVVDINLYHKVNVGEVRKITLNGENISIQIDFEVNKTLKELKVTVSPLLQQKYRCFWFLQNGAQLSDDLLVKNLKSSEIQLT
jgi:hypothetical protein